MVKGGYTIQEKQVETVKLAGVPWLDTPFELPPDTDPNLAVFFHISFSFKDTNPGTPQKILMTKNAGDPNESYTPLNNNSDVDGWFYRSDVTSLGDKLNFKVADAVTLTNYLFMLEE